MYVLCCCCCIFIYICVVLAFLCACVFIGLHWKSYRMDPLSESYNYKMLVRLWYMHAFHHKMYIRSVTIVDYSYFIPYVLLLDLSPGWMPLNTLWLWPCAVHDSTNVKIAMWWDKSSSLNSLLPYMYSWYDLGLRWNCSFLLKFFFKYLVRENSISCALRTQLNMCLLRAGTHMHWECINSRSVQNRDILNFSKHQWFVMEHF